MIDSSQISELCTFMINSPFTQFTLKNIIMCAYESEAYCGVGMSQHKSAESAETIAKKKTNLSEKIGFKRFSMQSHHFLKPVVHHCGVR